jgi:hypothetical protein
MSVPAFLERSKGDLLYRQTPAAFDSGFLQGFALRFPGERTPEQEDAWPFAKSACRSRDR